MKTCTMCNQEKPISEFYKNKGGKDGLRSSCKSCQSNHAKLFYQANIKRMRAVSRNHYKLHKEQDINYQVEYRKKYRDTLNAQRKLRHLNNPLEQVDTDLKRKYGITLKEYDDLFTSQGNACAICGSPKQKKRHAVDHDHATGRVRGLLCMHCNLMVGFVKDDIGILEKIAAYLRSHQSSDLCSTETRSPVPTHSDNSTLPSPTS